MAKIAVHVQFYSTYYNIFNSFLELSVASCYKVMSALADRLENEGGGSQLERPTALRWSPNC